MKMLSLPPHHITSPANPCLLNNLLPELKLEILKKLEFREYRNLAFTCRLWYTTASTAPNHVKPTHVSNELLITSESIHDEDYVADLSLINKWKCRYLTIKNHRFLFLKFVEKHQQIFDIGCIVIELPIVFQEVLPVTFSLLNLTSEVVLSNLSGASYYSAKDLWVKYSFYTEYFHHAVIVDYNVMIVDHVKDVLEEWIQGKRPNLQIIKAVVEWFAESEQENPMSYLTRDIQSFVMDRRTETIDDVIHEHAKVVVPGLPPMFIHTHENTVVVSRSISGETPSIMNEIEGRLQARAMCDEGIEPPTCVVWPFNINFV